MNGRAFWGEPCRLLGSCLPHADLIHLGFNLYWLFEFGKILETRWPRWMLMAFYAYLAAGSSAAEYAVSTGGIGLSGVGYGLFGYLWIASRRDASYKGAVELTTVEIFVGWFFLCIVLTYTQVWMIGNVAHGAGTVLGALAAMATLGPSDRRSRWRIAAAITMVVILWAATAGRPFVNLT